MEFDSLPSRGQTGKPGSPDAKFESTKFKKNQRSVGGDRSAGTFVRNVDSFTHLPGENLGSTILLK